MGNKEKFKMSKSDLAKAWKDAHAKKDEFAGGMEYEDGRYNVALTDASRGESKGSGRDQVVFEFTFLDGDYEGKTVRDYNGLDRVEAIPFLMRKIQALGFEPPEDVMGLEDVLEQIVKAHPKLKIRLKTKGEFQNVFIDRVVESDEGDDNPAEEPVDEEPVPAPKNKVTRETPEPASNGAEEEVDVSVGMKVECFNDDDESVGVGVIKTIDEEAAEVIVRLDSGKNQVFSVDKIRLVRANEPVKKGLKARK